MNPFVAAFILTFAVFSRLGLGLPGISPPDRNVTHTHVVPRRSLSVTPDTVSIATIYDPSIGVRTISYSIDSHNLVIIEGDIIFGTIADLHEAEAKAQSKASGGPKLTRRGYANTSWPDATVLWRYASGDAERQLSANVEEAQKRWKGKAPYLNFVRKPNGNSGPDILTISLGNACSSQVGWRGYGQTYSMTLGTGCDADVVTHEFGHALGLWHEHTRPDRDTYVEIIWQNIPDNYRWYFDRYTDGEYTHTPYDANSIMHYTEREWGNGGITIKARKEGVIVPTKYRSYPSCNDLREVCYLNRAQCPEANEPKC